MSFGDYADEAPPPPLRPEATSDPTGTDASTSTAARMAVLRVTHQVNQFRHSLDKLGGRDDAPPLRCALAKLSLEAVASSANAKRAVLALAGCGGDASIAESLAAELRAALVDLEDAQRVYARWEEVASASASTSAPKPTAPEPDFIGAPLTLDNPRSASGPLLQQQTLDHHEALIAERGAGIRALRGQIAEASHRWLRGPSPSNAIMDPQAWWTAMMHRCSPPCTAVHHRCNTASTAGPRDFPRPGDPRRGARAATPRRGGCRGVHSDAHGGRRRGARSSRREGATAFAAMRGTWGGDGSGVCRCGPSGGMGSGTELLRVGETMQSVVSLFNGGPLLRSRPPRPQRMRSSSSISMSSSTPSSPALSAPAPPGQPPPSCPPPPSPAKRRQRHLSAFGHRALRRTVRALKGPHVLSSRQ